jgi:CO dehydrogenase maturation factor
MKISVCGKGGSGKSTIVTLLAGEAQSRGYKVLVVDSDESNAGLFRILGFSQPPIPLMEIVGGKKKIISTLREPAASDLAPKAMVLTQDRIAIEDIPADNVVERDNLKLVSVGKILQALEGCACPFGVLSREFLKRLDEGDNGLVIVDMEAGVEHFGRGVEESVDAVLMVVEPSFESLELEGRIDSLATGTGIKNVSAIINKVPSDDIASKLEDELAKRSIDVIGCIHHDSELLDSSLEGGALRTGRAADEIRGVLDLVLSQASG